jgi:archaellum component FlaC
MCNIIMNAMSLSNGHEDSSLMFFGVLVCSLAYLAINPVTLPCIGCDKGGMFYKCMGQTGLDTVTCEAWTKGSRGVGTLKDEVMSISSYSSELIKFSSHLPQYLKEFAAVLMGHIRNAAGEVYARLENVAEFAKGKIMEVFASLKKVVFDAWSTVYDKAIRPVISALIKYVLEPITSLMDKIIEFAKMVIDGVRHVIGKAGDIVSKAYDSVHHAAEVLSESVELVMKKSAQIIESVVDGLRTGINRGLEEVVGAAEETLNSVSNAMGAALGGLEGAVNASLKGTTGVIEKGVNTLGEGITDAVSGLEGGINKSVGGMRDAMQTAVTGLVSGVEKSVNTLGEGVAGGLDGVLSETEQIVNDLGNVVEGSVNDVVGLLNKGLVNPIESTINSSGDIIENALEGIMVPVRSITDGLNKLSNTRINMGPIYDGRPFSFLRQVDTPDAPKIGRINMKDIPRITVPDVTVPGVRYVKPKGSLGGRQRLQESIKNAEKNWKFALDKAASSKRPYKNCGDADAVSIQGVGSKKGMGLGTYSTEKVSRDYSFLPPMGAGGHQGGPQAAVSRMRKGESHADSEPEPIKVSRCVAPHYREPSPLLLPLGKATASSKDILIPGINLPPVTIPKVPAVKLDTPNLRVDIKAPVIKVPKPPVDPVQLKAPTVKFDVEIDSKVPQVPNIVQGISDGVEELGKLLSGFFKPVWAAFASLQGMVMTTISMIMHFFKNEVSWENISRQVSYAMNRGWEGTKEVARLAYKEVIVPMVNVLYFMKDKIVWVVREFSEMAMDFLGDIYTALKQLGHNLWEKVIPVLKQAGLVTTGVAAYGITTFLDKVPPFSMLPAASTTKLYIFLVLLIMFLIGSQVRFMKDVIVSSLKVGLSPLMALDRAFDRYVVKNIRKTSLIARIGGIK